VPLSSALQSCHPEPVEGTLPGENGIRKLVTGGEGGMLGTAMRRGEIRHWPFASKKLENFEVIEERHKQYRLFPHTDQLPVLSEIINQEFAAGLTTRLAATDARADGYRKLQLSEAAFVFCTCLNGARSDHLHVQPFYTPDMIAQIAIIQQITELAPEGNRHWFRQFRDKAFLPDFYLSGKHIVFSTHALERFGERTTIPSLNNVVQMWGELLRNPLFVLQLNGNELALTVGSAGTVAAMPFKETEDEMFILTTLGPKQINLLEPLEPPRQLHIHYGREFSPPPLNRVEVDGCVNVLLKYWREKKPPDNNAEREKTFRGTSWTHFVQLAQGILREKGYTDQTNVRFRNGLYGPSFESTCPTPLRPFPVEQPAVSSESASA
jgi:hypothetical protein